jgi:DNA-binding IscR family transcriptional regulator
LIDTDKDHRSLYRVFMEVRNAAAQILENTSLADIAGKATPKRNTKAEKGKAARAH